MKIDIREGLPFISATVTYKGQTFESHNVVLDTGSVATIFSAGTLLPIGVTYELDDYIRPVRGIGGREFVFTKVVDSVSVGNFTANDFGIQVGAMDYGFDIDGIIGLDFLLLAGAIVNLSTLDLNV